MSCSPCKYCYDLEPVAPGAPKGVYCVVYKDGTAYWYYPSGARVTDAVLLTELFDSTDTAQEQADTEVSCGVEREYVVKDICDTVAEFGIAYNLLDAGGGNWDFTRFSITTGSTLQNLATVGASSLNCLGFDSNNSILYAYNTITAELHSLDISNLSSPVHTNLGTVTALDATPLTTGAGRTYTAGAYDTTTGRFYISGATYPIVAINVSTLEASTVSAYTLPAGTGDFTFDTIGRVVAYAGNGDIVQYPTFLNTSSFILATIVDNGSGHGESFGISANRSGENVAFGVFVDDELWQYDLRTDIQTNTGNTVDSVDFADTISPRYVGACRIGYVDERDNSIIDLGYFDAKFQPYTPRGNINPGMCPIRLDSEGFDFDASPLVEVTGVNSNIPFGLESVCVQCTNGQILFNGIQLSSSSMLCIAASASTILPALVVTPITGNAQWEWGGFQK